MRWNTSIKIVIFDLDGTLMNAYPAVARSVNFVMQKFGHPPISHAKIKRTVGWGDRHLLQSLLGTERLDQALRVYRRHHAVALRKDTKLLSGALGVLQMLKVRKIKMAIASNRPEKFSLIALRYLKIEKFFDEILCGDKVARPKPAPDLIKEILRRCDLHPQEALYVGDMQIDIDTGRRARVKTIAVATGSNTKAELVAHEPFAVIDRISQLRPILGFK